jgi:hypothetical protein
MLFGSDGSVDDPAPLDESFATMLPRGRRPNYGLKLPDDVPAKNYRENAAKVFPEPGR